MDVLRQLASRYASLELLVLFGSRAVGSSHAGSDWDFGFRADATFDPSLLWADLARVLETEAVDLVDLDRAGGLVRFRVARDGEPLYEREPGAFFRFWFGAVTFWLDAEPTLSGAYEHLLSELSE
jgi:uncharacterized protein